MSVQTQYAWRPSAHASRMRSITSLRRAFAMRDRRDRRASGRQFVDHRHVEIGVSGHRQRARNRRRGQHELMRHAVAAAALVAQREPLVHAETVLLVDDDEAELARTRRLPASARACRSRSAPAPPARRAPCARLAVAACRRARRPRRRAAPASGEIEVMLFGEQFGRRHQRDLISRFDRGQRGERGDDGLAGTDVALHEAQHRRCRCQVVRDFRGHTVSARWSARTAARRGIASRSLPSPRARRRVLAHARAAVSGSAAARAILRMPGAAARDARRLRAREVRVRRRPMHVSSASRSDDSSSHAQPAESARGVVAGKSLERAPIRPASRFWPRPSVVG